MEHANFRDFDDETVYQQSLDRALNDAARNFVVEFGKSKAHIAFDLGVEDAKALLSTERKSEIPVRWMYVICTFFTLIY